MKHKIVKINNIQELMTDLARVYEDLRSGSAKPGEVKEINNTAGKLIGACKVSIEYANARREVPEIDFLKRSI